ncbi:MAG TPA: fatty acid desaturase [Pirellulaceae bacterium]|nr:fatty acid desaturase [Pirellulaceae bacterium]
MSQMSNAAFKEARRLVQDLFQPKPWVYWTDFLVTMVVAYSAAISFIKIPNQPVPLAVGLYLIAIVGLYRLSLFIHEISHLGKRAVPGFTTAWNILVGIPNLLPSFFYETHREHHNTHHFGTKHDGEYLPLASGRWSDVLAFLAQIFYLPLLTFVRHLIVTPLSFLHPGLRRWTLEHWSSFVINLSYRREIRPNDPVHWWAVVEIGCHLRAVLLLVLVVVGIDPWHAPFFIYLLAVGTLTMNHVRTMAAHRYRSDGQSMSLQEQMLDSTDIQARDPLTLAMCPVGLRFHALHHLFPGIPYHNLETAHRRLMQALPAEHPYRSCVYPSLWSAIGELFEEFFKRRAERKESNSEPDRWQHAA